MTPIRWDGQAQRLPRARIDPRPDLPTFFGDGMGPRHHGRAVGRTEPVRDGAPRLELGRSIGGDRLNQALDS